MTNSINHSRAVGEIQDRIGKQPSKARTAEAPAPAAGDQVTVTDGARQLTELVSAAAAEPGFDQARVDALRQAIEDGSYRVDAQRLAASLMDFERQFDR